MPGLSWQSRKTLPALVFTVGTALPLFGGAQRAEANTVWVEGPRVKLSDLTQQIETDVDLGPAPAPGTTRRIPRSALPPAAESLTKGDSLTIRTRSQTLRCPRLTELLRKALASQIEQHLAIESVDCPRELRLPTGPLQVAAHLTERGRRAGRLAARVSLRAGRWPERLIVVPLFVDGQQPVIVAARDLPAGVPLSPADARLEHRRAASVRSDAVDSVDALEGKQPRATIVAGQTIRTRQLAAVPLVKRGSRVTVSVVLPGLRLRSSGEVREDGGQGETVMVLCTSTRKLLRARVVGPRDVQIDL